MPAAQHLSKDEYRVLLICASSRTLYARKERTGYRLVRVNVPTGSRPARQIQQTLRKVWNLPVVVLDLMVSAECDRFCAAAEVLQHAHDDAVGRIKPDQILNEELSARERGWIQAILDGRAAHAITRAGWTDEACEWVETNTSSRLSTRADIEQFNAGNGFSLLQFHLADRSSYWLKATGAPNTQERSMSLLLARLCRDYVADVVADRPEWNAWLMRDIGSRLLAPGEKKATVQLLKGPLESLAGLQMTTVGCETALLEAGAFDHRVSALRNNADSLFHLIEYAMGCQTTTRVEPIGSHRLRELKHIFEDACAFVERLGIPDTVLQGDTNWDNIVFDGTRCRFIDWSEARVGNPLVTLEHILLANQTDDPTRKTTWDEYLRNIYRAAMSPVCAASILEAASPCAPLLAAASTIVGRRDWVDASDRTDPRMLKWVRTIARHMDRAAQAPTLLRTLRP